MNIITHILEEQYPVPVSSRSSLPSLPNAPSLSPMKRKNKAKEDVTTNISILKGSPNKGIGYACLIFKKKNILFASYTKIYIFLLR